MLAIHELPDRSAHFEQINALVHYCGVLEARDIALRQRLAAQKIAAVALQQSVHICASRSAWLAWKTSWLESKISKLLDTREAPPLMTVCYIKLRAANSCCFQVPAFVLIFHP